MPAGSIGGRGSVGPFGRGVMFTTDSLTQLTLKVSFRIMSFSN